MIQFMLDLLELKCIAEDKYLPKNITRDKFYKVIGTETFDIKEGNKDTGKVKDASIVNFFVVNDEKFITKIAHFNCEVNIKQ